jgi:hypothetical protein
VITTEGGLWEQVVWGVEALYANPFDTEAFGHAVCAILQHQRVYDNLAKYGSQKVRARFTWTGIAQQILRLADELPQGLAIAKRGAKRSPDKTAVEEEAESEEPIPEIEVGAGLAETLPSA